MRMHLLFFLLLLLCTTQATGQNDPVANITVNYGGSVYFHFNSLNKYETGITYTNYTQLKISYTHDAGTGVPVGSNWELVVQPMQDKLYGDGGNELELGTLALGISIDGGAESTAEQLTVGELIIASGTQTSLTETHTIVISYYCGTVGTESAMGKTPDYYYIDLEFILRQAP